MNESQTIKMSHHSLRVWGEAVALVKLVHGSPIGNAELRNQASRAAVSAGLNIVEGSVLVGNARGRHFRIAKGSAAEVVGAYELAAAIGERVPVQEVLARGNTVAAMLQGLLKGRRARLHRAP